MMNNDFKRRIEEASLNAWPAINQLIFDGWILRFSKGYTKRANSVNPLYSANYDYTKKIKVCEALYKKNNLPTIFRLNSFSNSAGLDKELERLNYQYIVKASVMYLNLKKEVVDPSIRSIFKEQTLENWMKIFVNLSQNHRNNNQVIHKDILKKIFPESVFMALSVENRYVSCCLAVIEDGLCGLFDLITDTAFRRKGYAAQLMKKMLALGKERGAHHAYLQVVCSNRPAIQLYEKLGFKKLYHYWYRIKR